MLLQPVDFFLSKKATSLLCQDAHGANKKYEIAAKASGMFLGGLSGSGSVRVRVTPNWMAKSHSKQIHVFLTLFSPRNPQKKFLSFGRNKSKTKGKIPKYISLDPEFMKSSH